MSTFTLEKVESGKVFSITSLNSDLDKIQVAIRALQDATGGVGSVTSISDVDTDVAELFSTAITNASTTPQITYTRSTKAQNLVYASPSGSSGKGSFISLTLSHIPTVTYLKGGNGLTTLGTAYQMLRVNSGGTANEWTSILGGSSKLTVTKNANDITFDVVPSAIEIDALAATVKLSIAKGGTGQDTAQKAINALTAVSAATDEYVLTKDTATGNALWKVSAVGITEINGQTGATVTLRTDDINEGATNLYYTEARVAANTAVALNTAKVTNATHKGDVTGDTALTIAAQAVTYAKIQNISATKRLLGRVTAAAGVTEEIQVAGNLALNSTSIISKLSVVRTLTGSGAITITDGTILLNGMGITATLPDTSTIAIGDEFIVKNITSAATNILTVYNVGTDLIDGESSYNLTLAYDCIWIKYVSAKRFSIISKIVNV